MIPNRTLLAIGFAVAILIGVTAVFFASSDPDGLESAALVVMGEKSLTAPAPPGTELKESPHPGISYLPPFPDYSLGEGGGHLGQILAMALGIALTLGAAIGITRLLGRPARTEEDQ